MEARRTRAAVRRLDINVVEIYIVVARGGSRRERCYVRCIEHDVLLAAGVVRQREVDVVPDTCIGRVAELNLGDGIHHRNIGIEAGQGADNELGGVIGGGGRAIHVELHIHRVEAVDKGRRGEPRSTVSAATVVTIEIHRVGARNRSDVRIVGRLVVITAIPADVEVRRGSGGIIVEVLMQTADGHTVGEGLNLVVVENLRAGVTHAEVVLGPGIEVGEGVGHVAGGSHIGESASVALADVEIPAGLRGTGNPVDGHAVGTDIGNCGCRSGTSGDTHADTAEEVDVVAEVAGSTARSLRHSVSTAVRIDIMAGIGPCSVAIPCVAVGVTAGQIAEDNHQVAGV